MKLSEKILKGSEMMPQLAQCKGMFFRVENYSEPYQACAYGFAAIGEEGLRMVGESEPTYFNRIIDKAQKLFDKDRGTAMPSGRLNLSPMVADMNDNRECTIEQIIEELQKKGY